MLDFNFADGINNTLELVVLTSSENVEKVIKSFRHLYFLYNREVDPNELLHRIYDKYNINEDLDFTNSDINRLNRELNNIVRRGF